MEFVRTLTPLAGGKYKAGDVVHIKIRDRDTVLCRPAGLKTAKLEVAEGPADCQRCAASAVRHGDDRGPRSGDVRTHNGGKRDTRARKAREDAPAPRVRPRRSDRTLARTVAALISGEPTEASVHDMLHLVAEHDGVIDFSRPIACVGTIIPGDRIAFHVRSDGTLVASSAD